MDQESTRRKQVNLVPKLLPLSHNYRSHAGILSVASVVMDTLYSGTGPPLSLPGLVSLTSFLGFPQLVDELPPEIGDHAGPEPALYSM
jgi:hypothetical protein